jgi:heptosyltransferase-1
VPRILFIKTSSLGDVVHNGPAVSDVARHLPGAEIDWVVEEPFAEIAALHGAVRRVIPVAIRRWRAAPFARRTWAEMGAFRRALRERRYERVIDSQGLLKSALVCALARGERHGFDRRSAREPLAARFYDTRHSVQRGLHAVERNRRLAAAALGFEADGPCDYGFSAEGTAPLAAGGPLAVLLSMSSRAEKLWDDSRWIELGGALAQKGLQCVLPWGSAAERERSERIAAAIPRAAAPRRMGLAELARLMRGAHCVVGLDTGLAHLAGALGAVSIGIFCGSDPRLTGLYGAARARSVGGPGAPPQAAQVLAALESLL